MSVTATVQIGDGLFKPLHQLVRGGSDGKSPVGTVHVLGQAVGDSGGGTAQILMQMRRIEFGMRCIFAPVLISVDDDLASPEAVRLAFSASANIRTTSTVDQSALTLASQGGNHAKFPPEGFLFESDTIATATLLQFIWSTNSDGKVYRAHLIMSVFDAELIEAQGSVSDFLAGVR